MSVEVKGLSVNINAPQGISASIKRFKKLDVNVGAVTITTPGYIPPTYEGETEVTPDKSTQTLNTDGYFVKDDITIHPIPDEYIVPEGTKNIVTNGEHDVKDFEKVDVDVPIPDGYVKLPQLSNEGTSLDLVAGKELIDSEGNVVEGLIPTRSSDSVSVSGATVTVLSGLYEEQVTKSVATATQATPSITVSSGGLITAKATQSAGYVASGTKQATKQLTVQVAKTVTPTKSSQTAVSSGRYTTGAVTVAPIPDQYIVPSGEKEITEKGKYDVTEYASVNVDIDGEIPEGYYDASGIDTEPSKVLSGKEFINESGKQVGSMPNKGAVNATIQGLVSGMSTPQPYTIPEGYHNGQGKVQISSDVKTLHDNIAKALRNKGQVVSANYDPKQFPSQIGNIQTSEDLDSVLTEQEELIAELQETLMGKAAGGGGATPTQEKTVNITTNGTHTVTPDAGYALSKVTANVSVLLPEAEYIEVTPTKDFQHITPSAGKIIGAVGVNPIPDKYIVPDWEYKQVTPTKEFQHVVPSEGKVLDAVGVDPIPDEYIVPQGEKEITENGQYDVSSFASVKVNVEGGGGEPDPSALYQRVEYIESAEEGTFPYIVTDFCADNDSGVEVVASFPILQDRIPMGSREDSGSTRFYCCYPLSSTGSYYGFNSGSTLSGSFAVNTKYICQTNFLCSRMAGIFTPNGDRKSSGIITSTLTTQSGPVSIFGYRYCSTGNMATKREYKFYGARLSQLFEVVREYIPCYRKSDGVVGVYEKFTGQFLTNDADTGSFAKGADIDW